jgi:hypothetical protein
LGAGPQVGCGPLVIWFSNLFSFIYLILRKIG